jgi:hypothetical protein
LRNGRINSVAAKESFIVFTKFYFFENSAFGKNEIIVGKVWLSNLLPGVE